VLGVPSSELLPELVKAVAVSKPNRDTWLVEELLDSFTPWDEGVEVRRTRFPGVLLVLSRRLDPATIARLSRRVEFSFMTRLIPATIALHVEAKSELVGALERLLRGVTGDLDLIVTIRGEGKSVVSESEVKSLITGMNYRLRRGAVRVLAVESVDRLFVLAVGVIRSCGLNCKLLVVE
jgi:hypothetical protein